MSAFLDNRAKFGTSLSEQDLRQDRVGTKSGEEFDARVARYNKAQTSRDRVLGELRNIPGVPHRIIDKMEHCGSELWFRRYLLQDDVRLVMGHFCQEYKLCQFCALRRSSKLLQVIMKKVKLHMATYPQASPFLLTFTVKDGPDLSERFRHINSALKALQSRARKRRNMGKGLRTELEKVLGSFQTLEIKRGGNSGLWHPHIHMVCFLTSEINVPRLIEEWLEITGDSFILDLRPLRAETEEELARSLCEVCAYVLKFSEMTGSDAWDVYRVTKRKHLRQSFGTMRFSKEELDDLEDCDHDEELPGPYEDFMLKWSIERGYFQACDFDFQKLEDSPF